MPKQKPRHYFAGLWDERRDRQAGETVVCVIITDANDFVGELHDRMPVILELGAARSRLPNSRGYASRGR